MRDNVQGDGRGSGKPWSRIVCRKKNLRKNRVWLADATQKIYSKIVSLHLSFMRLIHTCNNTKTRHGHRCLTQEKKSFFNRRYLPCQTCSRTERGRESLHFESMVEFCIYIKAFSQFILWPYWHCTFACIMWFCVHCTHIARCRHFYWRRSLSNWKLQRAQFLIIDLICEYFSYWRYNDDSRGFHFLRSVSSFSLSRVVYNFKSFKSIHWPFEHIYLLFRFVSFCLNLSDTDIFDWLETFAQQTCLTCLHFSLNVWCSLSHWLDAMNSA